jgi:D-cysteine desulfhydrase
MAPRSRAYARPMEIGRRACLGGLTGTALLALGGAKPRAPLAIERLYPAFAALPRAGLWEVEPPVRTSNALARALDMRGELHIMRDDEGGTVFGGGKARKLDLILGDAIARGVSAVSTTGGTGSNHARSTAFAARSLGLACHLALLPEPDTAEVKRNLAEMQRRGATITIGDRGAVERARKAAETSGAFWIPMGGTSALGNVAFVDAAIAHAARAASHSGVAGWPPVADHVVTALGSTGTAVGLAVGFAIAGVPTRVLAVRASSPGTSSRAVVDAGIDATVALLRNIAPSISPDIAKDAKARLEIDPAELGAGYGISTARGRKAEELVFGGEKIMLEQTYGAKAAAALVRRAKEWKNASVVLWMGSDARWLAGRVRP